MDGSLAHRFYERRAADCDGIGSQREQTRKLWADQMAFALWQFGDPEYQPK